MKMEVYTVDEITRIVSLIEAVQDGLEVEDHDILWDMLQEAINTLLPEGGAI